MRRVDSELLCHCNVCPMVHTKIKLSPFNIGEERVWSKLPKYTG